MFYHGEKFFRKQFRFRKKIKVFKIRGFTKDSLITVTLTVIRESLVNPRILKTLIFFENEIVFERTFLHDKTIFFGQDCFNGLDYTSSVLENCFGEVRGSLGPSLKKVWRAQEKV